jgi:peptidoglycan hydrolase-like protein with peptidoglycan-binding domain
MHRTGYWAVAGIVAIGLAACSSGSSKSSGSTTTRTPPPITSVVPATATTGSPPTSLAPGQTATSVAAAGASTTAAGRVVTSPSSNVHLGDSGSGVRQIQTALVAHGFKVSVDGQFGAQTAQAVKSFQQQNGLAADGIVGPATWAKLQATSTSTTVKGSTTTTKSTTTTAKTTTTTVKH